MLGWKVRGVSVGVISEWQPRVWDSCWKTGGLCPGGSVQLHILQEELRPGGWHFTSCPGWHEQRSIGLSMCDFFMDTFGQLGWVHHDSSLCPLVCLVHLEFRASAWHFKSQSSVQEEWCGPGAAPSGGQLLPTGEDFRASDWNFEPLFSVQENVAALVQHQVEGSSNPLGRSSEHRWRNTAAG